LVLAEKVFAQARSCFGKVLFLKDLPGSCGVAHGGGVRRPKPVDVAGNQSDGFTAETVGAMGGAEQQEQDQTQQ
jgi:hypothetical protein